jgi:ketosteroid isomerase-like protein
MRVFRMNGWRERVIILRCMRTAAARLVIALMLGGCSSMTYQGQHDALADAERAFARDGLERGVRAAFVAHFAPDGLVFEPAPTRVREVWPTRPAPADPLALRLEWRPELVDVARAGDLGISTGPFRLVDTTGRAPASEGVFFSVWQRQDDGTWKVWLDMGARDTGPFDASRWRDAPRARVGPQDAAAPTATTLGDLDKALSGIAGPAFAQRLSHNARRHRDAETVAVGMDWEKLLAGLATGPSYEPSEARVSASGDLAASYGRITENRGERGSARGYYVHVWVRDGGAWWLAAETAVFER